MIMAAVNRLLLNYNGPRSDLPFLYETVLHVRIVLHEQLRRGSILRAKDEKRHIYRVRERSAQDQFSAALRITRQSKMLFAKWGSARNIIFDYVVN
jgi:hypothetical protein